MRNRFEQQLFELNREIIEMGALCEEAIEAAAKVNSEHDGECAVWGGISTK